MTSDLKGQLATIRTVNTNFLNINQEFTVTKWNSLIKHPDIFLLDNSSTAKLVDGKSGTKAILGNRSFVPGITQETVEYFIHQGSILNIGIATSTRNLSSIEPGTDLAFMKFNVINDTTLVMTLSRTKITTTNYSSTLTFKYNDITTTINTTGYTGQQMYPWLSDDINGSGFSVSISRASALKTYVRDDGAIVFSTVNESGISRPIIFETGINNAIFDNIGFAKDPSINFNIIESATTAINTVSSFDMKIRVKHTDAPTASNPSIIINESATLTAPGGLKAPNLLATESPLALGVSGGVPITIDSGGIVVIPTSILVPAIQTNVIKSTNTNSLTLSEPTGRGIKIESGTGNVALSHTLTVGNSGLSNGNVIASFGDNLFNKALIVPQIANTDASTIPAANAVVGMIAYNISTGKFVGYTASNGWVNLSI